MISYAATGTPFRLGPFRAAAVVTVLLIASAVAPARSDSGAATAREFLNGRQLRIMAPAATGGGWDRTAHEMQAALRDVAGRTEVCNAGAGLPVGRFDPGHDYPDAYLAGTGLRHVPGDELQDIGVAVVATDDRLHRPNVPQTAGSGPASAMTSAVIHSGSRSRSPYSSRSRVIR